ncbi:PREDICTED: BRCA1-associated RING domain protein 1-like [Papilio polytes]|uniref:BRCA1-associated RING domain protein 1-like n=1 Tax=Papilio polytes TaxID=76194 RepID=UPI000675EF7B|nr:PREDICTED: BRCA1-associated RING domain protein 1-like [Papilio polytes]
MSSSEINSFLMALEAVKQDYTCRACKQLCKKPVTLMCCFHYICEVHIDELIKCPYCEKPLQDKRIFKDDRLEASVNSAIQLDKMFSSYKTETSTINVSKENSTKKNKSRNAKKPVTKSKDKENCEATLNKKVISENPNMSILSIATSSKLTKNAEKRNKKGETPLHVSCRLGNIERVKQLLEDGANSNTKDNAGWTPLHEAVQSGRLDLVRLLFQYKTLINVPGPDNETPLHEAVRYNHKDIVNELVTHGADLDAKNSKGETPIQLANGEMRKLLERAAENVIHTQTADVSHISTIQMELDYDDIQVYCVSEYITIQKKLKTLVKHHKNIHIETKLTNKVTHLIIDSNEGICLPTLDVLQAIVYGIWILSTDWILKSTENKLETFIDYEIKGVGTINFNGPKKSRYNKYKQLPGLFNGCHFYFHNFNTNYEISKTLILNKTVLSKLITEAGGVVLRRIPNPESIPETEKLVPYHARKGGKLEICSHYIIFKDMYEPMYNMKHLKALPIGWLLECIEKYELCEPE